MKIAQGVEMLEISADVMGKPGNVYPTLIWDKETVILVDTGFPGQLPLIREAAEKAGAPFDKLDRIIITHHDIDHIGSLSNILKESCQKIEVIAHEEEKPFIQGENCPTKLAQMEVQLSSLPPEQKAIYDKMKAAYEHLTANVDQTVTDGEELPYCGGITVIYTPGHTPGHISLYHKPSKALITGDMLMVEQGQLVPTPELINWDHCIFRQSLQKLTRYDIETLICYHGGLFRQDVNHRIARLASESISKRNDC